MITAMALSTGPGRTPLSVPVAQRLVFVADMPMTVRTLDARRSFDSVQVPGTVGALGFLVPDDETFVAGQIQHRVVPLPGPDHELLTKWARHKSSSEIGSQHGLPDRAGVDRGRAALDPFRVGEGFAALIQKAQ